MNNTFLDLFGLVDFDDNGEVSAVVTKDGQELVSLAQSRSNFLYLIAKYNLNILKQEKGQVSEFFTTELSNMLENIESDHGDFNKCFETIIKYCSDKVKNINFSNRKDFIEKLNQLAKVQDKDFEKLIAKKQLQNGLHLSYLANAYADKMENGLLNETSSYILGDKSLKKNLFKDIINYNALMGLATKAGSSEAYFNSSVSLAS